MKNYICLNGKQVPISDEQAQKLKEEFCAPNVMLQELAPGDTFSIGQYEFIVLEHICGGTAVILKDVLEESVFGKNNNFDGSKADNICRKFAEVVAEQIGEENLLLHDVDLTSDDGLEDYGVVIRCISILTTERYRKYVEILDKYKLDCWQWLATPFSTKRHEGDRLVKCVAPSGVINYGVCNNYDYGVRPFCIFKSTIFVSR